MPKILAIDMMIRRIGVLSVTAAICAEWGGGGHKRAAGATIDRPLGEAVALVADRLVRAAAEGGAP